MKTIVFINEKGGVGKTTLCFNTAWEFALNGKVLLIDLDGQVGNMTYLCGKEDTIPTVTDVLDGKVDASDAIVQVSTNLYLLPADSRIAETDNYDNPYVLRETFGKIKEEFEYVFIDVSPSPNRAQAFALVAADYCLCPVLPDAYAIPSIYGVTKSVEEIRRKYNPKLKLLGVIINQYSVRTTLCKQACEAIKAATNRLGYGCVFTAKIRDTVRLKESADRHVGISEYAPKTFVASSIIELGKEIEWEIAKNG